MLGSVNHPRIPESPELRFRTHFNLIYIMVFFMCPNIRFYDIHNKYSFESMGIACRIFALFKEVWAESVGKLNP